VKYASRRRPGAPRRRPFSGGGAPGAEQKICAFRAERPSAAAPNPLDAPVIKTHCLSTVFHGLDEFFQTNHMFFRHPRSKFESIRISLSIKIHESGRTGSRFGRWRIHLTVAPGTYFASYLRLTWMGS